jgi:hypothetical protein
MNITLNVRNLDDEHVMMTKESLQTLLVLLDADPKNVVRNVDAPGKTFVARTLSGKSLRL